MTATWNRARGVHRGMDGTLNKIELTYPDGKTYLCTTKI